MIDWVQSVTVSNDSKFFASASSDRSIKVFDIDTKQETHRFLDVHTGSVQSFKFIRISLQEEFIPSKYHQITDF